MRLEIAREVFIRTDWSAFTTTRDILPPRDPDEEDENKEDQEGDSADEPAVVREPNEE